MSKIWKFPLLWYPKSTHVSTPVNWGDMSSSNFLLNNWKDLGIHYDDKNSCFHNNLLKDKEKQRFNKFSENSIHLSRWYSF